MREDGVGRVLSQQPFDFQAFLAEEDQSLSVVKHSATTDKQLRKLIRGVRPNNTRRRSVCPPVANTHISPVNAEKKTVFLHPRDSSCSIVQMLHQEQARRNEQHSAKF